MKNIARPITALALLIAAFTSGCTSSTAEIPASLASARTPGTLAPGDALKFYYPGDMQLNQAQRIRPDGTVSLPSVGEVKAGGKPLGQFQRELSQLYKPHLANNEVVVSVESNSSVVSVTGAVNKPTEVGLDRSMTLYEAIQKAGGFSNLANDKKVVVVRTANGRHYTQTFDLSGVRKGREVPVFYLRPYDSVQVRERFF
jgi:polysaccharide export outer membrane protein